MANSQRTEELLKADLAHVIHPAFIVGQPTEVLAEKAHGIMVVDTEGKEYIDVSSQLGCCNLGHGQKEIQDAIIEAITKTDYTTMFIGWGSPLSIECAQKLSEITPGDLNHFFFSGCGGSEAIDSAIKIARLFWYNKDKGSKYKIISLDTSYHGASGISTHVTGVGKGTNKIGFGPEPSGFLHIPSFYCYRCAFGAKYPDCDMLCARFLERVIESEGADSIAAFIAEPIQGVGGVIDPPPEYWPIVRKICTEHEILLIGDEVMSGFARTGKMFAIEHYDTKLDIMAMAKGITGAYVPLGAVAVSDDVYEGLKGKPFMHAFTYCGHPIGCAAAIAAIDMYVKHKVADNAAKVGSHIRQRLEAEFLPLPCVGNIGGKGMFQAMELVNDKESKTPIDKSVREELYVKVREAGIFTRIYGVNTNRLIICPPCIMTMEEADRMLDIIKPLLAELKPQ